MPRVTMQATYRPAEGLKPQQPGATATEVNCANGHSGGAKANVSSKAVASHTDFANDKLLSVVTRIRLELQVGVHRLLPCSSQTTYTRQTREHNAACATPSVRLRYKPLEHQEHLCYLRRA